MARLSKIGANSEMVRSIQGICVIGTTPKCGKTVAISGVIASLIEEGFMVQGVKPLEHDNREAFDMTGSFRTPKNRPDQDFFDQFKRPMQAVDFIASTSAREMTVLQWNRLIETLSQMVYPVFLESPAQRINSPLKWEQDLPYDCLDFAMACHMPILLVAQKTPSIVEELTLNLTYLQDKFREKESSKVPMVGWIAVETQPLETPHWEEDVFYLSKYFQRDFLGVIPYHQGISVEKSQIGPLVELSRQAIDLFPIQKMLPLSLV